MHKAYALSAQSSCIELVCKSNSMPSILRRPLQDHYTFIGGAFVYVDGQALGENFEWISIK